MLTTRVTVFGAAGDRLEIGAFDLELLLLRKRSGQRRRRGHRRRLHRGLAPDAIEHVARELQPALAVEAR